MYVLLLILIDWDAVMTSYMYVDQTQERENDYTL